MKKYFSYIIIFVFAFFIYHIDSVRADVSLYFDESGNLIKDNYYQDDYDDYYSYENGVLYLTEPSNDFNYNEAFTIISKSDLKIVASDGVHIRKLETKKNLEITASKKSDVVYIADMIGGHNSDELYIHDINLGRLDLCVMFYNTIIENATIVPDNHSNSPVFAAGIISYRYTVTVGGEVVYEYTPEWSDRTEQENRSQ